MSTSLIDKRLPPWSQSVELATRYAPCSWHNLTQRNWAVSDVLAIHGAFKNSVDLLDIAEKGIGGTLSMSGVLSAVNAVSYCERADYMFWDIVQRARLSPDLLGLRHGLESEELVVSVKQLDTWTDKKHKLKALRPARSEAGREYGLLDELIYSEQLDLGQSHLLILARTYFQDFVWSGRKEAQPGRGRDQEQVEKNGEGKSKAASVKQGRRAKKHSFAVVEASENSGEKETEAGNAPSAMVKAKRSRPPSQKVLGNAQQ
eukprot:g47090.t1